MQVTMGDDDDGKHDCDVATIITMTAASYPIDAQAPRAAFTAPFGVVVAMLERPCALASVSVSVDMLAGPQKGGQSLQHVTAA